MNNPRLDVADRTSLEVAFTRIGVAPTPEPRHDITDDERHGYDATGIDAVIAKVVADHPASANVSLLQSLVSRSERSDDAVWFDTDRLEVVAMLLNQIADQAATAPSPARPGWITRLVRGVRRG